MEHKYYFPKTWPEIRKWLVGYKQNIGIHGAALGLTPTQITDEQAICDAIILAIDTADFAAAEAQKRNSEKNETLSLKMDLFRPLIKTHKSNTGYTEGIGKALGVIGEEIDFDPFTVKTKVDLKKTPQGVDIKFTLEHCESGNIYCKRGKDANFTFFKCVTHPHTIDTRPNEDGAASEKREYYVILLLNDVEVGVPSDVASISN
jgi:hypothetical protein